MSVLSPFSPPSACGEPIYSQLAGDPDLVDLVAMFVDEIPLRMAGLRECFQAGDREQLGTLAHQLKGASGSYGFEPLSPLAARLETAARQNEPEEAMRQALEALIEMSARLRADAP